MSSRIIEYDGEKALEQMQADREYRRDRKGKGLQTHKPLQRSEWTPERKPLNQIGAVAKRNKGAEDRCRKAVQGRDGQCVACNLLIDVENIKGTHPRTLERIALGWNRNEWAHIFNRGYRKLAIHPAYSLLLCCWHHDDHHNGALKIEAYREGCHQIQVVSDGTHKVRRVLTLDGLFTNEEKQE